MTRFRCDCTECTYIGIGNIAGNDGDLVDCNPQSLRSVAQVGYGRLISGLALGAGHDHRLNVQLLQVVQVGSRDL